MLTREDLEAGVPMLVVVLLIVALKLLVAYGVLR